MVATLAVRIIVVADLEQSIAFYREVFGFEPTDRFEGADPALDAMTQLDNVKLCAQLVRNADGVVFELVQFMSPAGFGTRCAETIVNHGITHLAFVVDSIDDARAKVIAHGGQALDHTRVLVKDDDVEMDGMFVSDPNGVRIEIARVPEWKPQFLWNGINVQNLQQSIDFYRVFGFEPAETFDLTTPRDWCAKLNEVDRISLFVQVIRDQHDNAIELISMKEPVPSSQEVPRTYNRFGLANLAFFTDDRDGIASKLASLGGTMFDKARVEINVNGASLKQWHGIDPNGARIELVQHLN